MARQCIAGTGLFVRGERCLQPDRQEPRGHRPPAGARASEKVHGLFPAVRGRPRYLQLRLWVSADAQAHRLCRYGSRQWRCPFYRRREGPAHVQVRRGVRGDPRPLFSRAQDPVAVVAHDLTQWGRRSRALARRILRRRSSTSTIPSTWTPSQPSTTSTRTSTPRPGAMTFGLCIDGPGDGPVCLYSAPALRPLQRSRAASEWHTASIVSSSTSRVRVRAREVLVSPLSITRGGSSPQKGRSPSSPWWAGQAPLLVAHTRVHPCPCWHRCWAWPSVAWGCGHSPHETRTPTVGKAPSEPAMTPAPGSAVLAGPPAAARPHASPGAPVRPGCITSVVIRADGKEGGGARTQTRP